MAKRGATDASAWLEEAEQAMPCTGQEEPRYTEDEEARHNQMPQPEATEARSYNEMPHCETAEEATEEAMEEVAAEAPEEATAEALGRR